MGLYDMYSSATYTSVSLLLKWYLVQKGYIKCQKGQMDEQWHLARRATDRSSKYAASEVKNTGSLYTESSQEHDDHDRQS